MADPVPDPEVARLIAAALSAHQQYRIAANKNQRQPAAIAARAALTHLAAALALNPARDDPAWKQGTPRTQVVLSDPSIAHFVRYVARADAQGL